MHNRPQSMSGRGSSRPKSGGSSSRKMRWRVPPTSVLQMAASSSRSISAMRANASGKSTRILFQYPAWPLTQPMQLLLLYPSRYIAGSSMPAPWMML
uniref:Uncharacterized protein n=1 Tax=uncultured marine virus TaxID=186617 RepID=A0A0F7L549_9VIRU|nr:hypothetical protein [uncultured marine virus]